MLMALFLTLAALLIIAVLSVLCTPSLAFSFDRFEFRDTPEAFYTRVRLFGLWLPVIRKAYSYVEYYNFVRQSSDFVAQAVQVRRYKLVSNTTGRS